MKKIRPFFVIFAVLLAAAGCRPGTRQADPPGGQPGNSGPGHAARPGGPPRTLKPAEADKLIFPDPANEIWIVRQLPSKGDLPLGERLPESDPLAAKVLAELRLPFHHAVIKLNQCARNLAKRAPGPNVLYLSKDEGGFPRHGLAIREGSEVREYPNLNYVDLVIDAERLAGGALSIYSHELGHVMMMNVGPALPERESVLQHVSMGITDSATAFNEGWGEHFQRLAFEGVPQYAKAFADGYDFRRGARSLWHSTIDEELRINGVLENLYIWQKALPVEETAGLGAEQLLLLDHTSPLFDRTRLKTGQQMLACEGVMATLFYRIDTDRALQDGYAPDAFYGPFLIAPLPAGIRPQDVFSPFENVMLKNFWVWSLMKEGATAGASAQKPPFQVFFEGWIKAFPQDREEVLRIFLSTTAGRTADVAPGRLLEKAGMAGIVGDYQGFVPAAGDYSKALAGLAERVLSGAVDLGAAIGPELWVENSGFAVRTTLWSPENKEPLRVNLNTCSIYELMTFPGITAVKARSIIAARDKAGFFASMDEARKAGFPAATR